MTDREMLISLRDQIDAQLHRPACYNCEHVFCESPNHSPRCQLADIEIPANVFMHGCEKFQQEIPF